MQVRVTPSCLFCNIYIEYFVFIAVTGLSLCLLAMTLFQMWRSAFGILWRSCLNGTHSRLFAKFLVGLFMWLLYQKMACYKHGVMSPIICTSNVLYLFGIILMHTFCLYMFLLMLGLFIMFAPFALWVLHLLRWLLLVSISWPHWNCEVKTLQIRVFILLIKILSLVCQIRL